MISAAISFFTLGIIAYVLGAYGVAGLSMAIGKMLLVAFLLVAAVSFLAALVLNKKNKQIR